MKNKKLTSDEIRDEAAEIRKEINALKAELRKLTAKAKKTAVRAGKLYDKLNKQYNLDSSKHDTKQKWLSKIVNDLMYWQDADHDVDLVIKSW